VLVRGEAPTRIPPIPHLTETPVVVHVPMSVSRRALVELVATLSLAHETHVLQYGQRVHSTLAGLLHRGAGLTALCSRLAWLSECSVAVLGTDLHLLAFDPGPAHLDPHAVTSAVKDAAERLAGLAPPRSAHHHVVVLDLVVRDRPVTCVAGVIELVEQRDGWVMLLDDAAAITAKTNALMQASMKLGEAMYKQTQEAGASGPGPDAGAGGGGAAGGKEDVVDAEFTEVDDDKKNKKSA